MDTNKEAQGIDREQIPETITFRTADRMTYGALGYDGNELMAFISGYDLKSSSTCGSSTRWRTRRRVPMRWPRYSMTH